MLLSPWTALPACPGTSVAENDASKTSSTADPMYRYVLFMIDPPREKPGFIAFIILLASFPAAAKARGGASPARLMLSNPAELLEVVLLL